MPTIDQLLLQRVPPSDLTAERAVLGTLLLDPDALPRVIEILRPSDFSADAHKRIYSTCVTMFGEMQPVDLVTLSAELRRLDQLDEVGGPARLAQIVEEAATASNLLAYCGIVREKAILRDLIRAATQIIDASYSQLSTTSIVEEAQRVLFDVTDRKLQTTESVRELLMAVLEQIQQLYERQSPVSGIPSGYPRLDRFTSGFQPGDLILIAARPSLGKTALALNIARYVGLAAQDRPARNVLFLSLEMSRRQLVQRLLCTDSRVNAQRLRTGGLESEDWRRITEAAGRLSNSRIYIDDTPALTVLQARAKARRQRADTGLDLVIIDYIQLMQGTGSNRQEEVSKISRALKAMARELDVPVIALSQLSRAPERRQDPRPQLFDLRESGALEQDADLILFLHRPDIGGEEAQPTLETEVNIGKQRNGPLGSILLNFVKAWASFEELSFRPEPELRDWTA